MFQLRLGTLLLGVAGMAFGFAIGRDSGFLVASAASSAWIALGLLQQSRDLWGARSQLASCDRSIIWGWRYAVAWRIAIATTIGGYWLLESSPEINRLIIASDDGTAWLFREGLFHIALIVGLSSAPWLQWWRSRTAFAVLLDVLGWTAGLFLASLALCQATVLEVLVHAAISNIEAAQPYRFSGQFIYDMDVAGDRERTRMLASLSLAMIAMSLICVWLASWLARRKDFAPRRVLLMVFLLLTLIASSSYTLWVHTRGFHGVSPFLADAQVLRPWPSWIFATLLLSLFAAGGAFRWLHREPDESREPTIVWHRGSGAYLNESRIVLITLSVSVIATFVAFSELDSPKELLSPSAWIMMAESLYYPMYTYLSLAVLWLSITGSFARRRVADIERRMTPVALSPVDFLVSWGILVGITIALVEAVAWSSFTFWLL